EMAHPRVEERVGLAERFDRLALVSILPRGFTIVDLGVGLRLCWELGGEAGGQLLSARSCARLDKHSCCQESDLYRLTVRHRAFGRRDGWAFPSPQDARAAERRELGSGSVGFHGRQVRGGPLRKDSLCVRAAAFIHGQIAET